jgi:3-phenylpropionate/trans-cinnamate dioxygenase ferredoxin component
MSELTAQVPAEDLPTAGQITPVHVDGRSIAVVNVAEEYFAVDGVCTHEECALADGYLEGYNIVCSCHGGTFDVRDGEPIAGPVYVPLTVYPVTSTGDTVTIHIDQGHRAE